MSSWRQTGMAGVNKMITLEHAISVSPFFSLFACLFLVTKIIMKAMEVDFAIRLLLSYLEKRGGRYRWLKFTELAVHRTVVC